jgi:hypothetical protein
MPQLHFYVPDSMAKQLRARDGKMDVHSQVKRTFDRMNP